MDFYYEPNPAFNLAKYGKVVTLNFNQQFAQRLHNILVDSNKYVPLESDVAVFLNNLDFLLDGNAEKTTSEQFVFHKFQYIFTVSCERTFAQYLHKFLNGFLAHNRISPAMFSFIKQFENCLYPQNVQGYADDQDK